MAPFSVPPFPALNLTFLSFFILLSLFSVIFSPFPSFLPSFLLHSLLSSLIPPSSPPTLLYLFLFSPRIYGCRLVFVSPTLHFTSPLPRTGLKLILTARTKWECTLLLISQRWKVVGAFTKHLKDQARLVALRSLNAFCMLSVGWPQASPLAIRRIIMVQTWDRLRNLIMSSKRSRHQEELTPCPSYSSTEGQSLSVKASLGFSVVRKKTRVTVSVQVAKGNSLLKRRDSSRLS